ncbi:hypothetical protein PVL30_004161 [Lodderomyces elongisporus]|uniref:uncharacterized protein n=1 Tax=Lodderomyces elongisporus TaxID=36914 RepID=UPI002925B2E1|nr:uncharacterized protein PVL30_004161 [Lodderomyces elongisporus]WLF80384.1 hypothetical protein PVL30_004161 [Lodderomyces elongisporus]
MVLLGDIVRQQQTLNNLNTSVPTLDELITRTSTVRNKIYDFQSSPSCHGMYIVTASIIASHLARGRKVVIIDTLNKFPIDLLLRQEKFNKNEHKRLITHYYCDTFGKLFTTLTKLKVHTDTVIIINEFHLLVDVYKLEMSSTFEEMILKHHVECNATYINNKRNGVKTTLPEIPPGSDLLKVSPIVKLGQHLDKLFRVLNRICIQTKSMVFLLGYMDTKYRPFQANTTREEMPLSLSSIASTSSSTTTTTSASASAAKTATPATTARTTLTPLSTNTGYSSFIESGRVVLAPYEFHRSITNRFLFYHEWYHKTPHFLQNYPTENGREKVLYVNQSMLRFVNAVKLETPRESFSPIYFDIDSSFYYDVNEADEKKRKLLAIRDLSQRRAEATLGTNDDSLCEVNIESVPKSTQLSSSQPNSLLDSTVIDVTNNDYENTAALNNDYESPSNQHNIGEVNVSEGVKEVIEDSEEDEAI